MGRVQRSSRHPEPTENEVCVVITLPVNYKTTTDFVPITGTCTVQVFKLDVLVTKSTSDKVVEIYYPLLNFVYLVYHFIGLKVIRSCLFVDYSNHTNTINTLVSRTL